MKIKCPACNGKKQIKGNVCQVCWGSGIVDYPDKEIKLKEK